MCEEISNDFVSYSIGSKEYWKGVYKQELQNFCDYGDEGDIWFGKANVERIAKWLRTNNINKDVCVLDVGCGNGMMLIKLAELGFQNLAGIDYVEEAIELAKRIAAEKGKPIKYESIDFLQDMSCAPLSSCMHQKYQVIIDKGTYDAIGMSPEDGDKKRVKYVSQVSQLLDTDGYLILVSCNWTKSELISHFLGFQIIDEIPVPTICFGGKSGQTVTSIIMRKS